MVIAFSLLPVYTLLLAGFDLSLMALLLVTLLLIVLHRTYETGAGLFRTKAAGGQLGQDPTVGLPGVGRTG